MEKRKISAKEDIETKESLNDISKKLWEQANVPTAEELKKYSQKSKVSLDGIGSPEAMKDVHSSSPITREFQYSPTDTRRDAGTHSPLTNSYDLRGQLSKSNMRPLSDMQNIETPPNNIVSTNNIPWQNVKVKSIGETQQGEKVFYDLVNLKDAAQAGIPLQRARRPDSVKLNNNFRATDLTASIDDNLSNSAGNVNYKNVTKTNEQSTADLKLRDIGI